MNIGEKAIVIYQEKIEKLKKVNRELVGTLQYLKATIKSGEGWTDVCEDLFNDVVNKAKAEEGE